MEGRRKTYPQRKHVHYNTPPGSATSSHSEDMELNKQRRRHEAVMKARKKNMVAKSLLQDKIHMIDHRRKIQVKQLLREKRLLEEELSKTESTQTTRLPSIAPSTSITISNASLDTEPCTNCMFGTTKTIRCKNFPCLLPQTYHTIGSHDVSTSYSKLSNYRELQRRSNDVRPPTSHRRRTVKEVDVEIKSTRKSVDDKIRGLGYLIREMRESHEKNKPINWSTNYGQPFPRRLLLRPTIATSLNM